MAADSVATPVHSRCSFLAGEGHVPDPTCPIMATWLQPATCICPHRVHSFSARALSTSLLKAHRKESKYQFTTDVRLIVYFLKKKAPPPAFLQLLRVTEGWLSCHLPFRVLSLWKKQSIHFAMVLGCHIDLSPAPSSLSSQRFLTGQSWSGNTSQIF